MPLIPAWLSLCKCVRLCLCVCVFVCVCESRRRREREESLMCMSAVPLGTYCTSQCVLDWRAEPRCILLQCNYLGCIYYVSTDSVTHICTQHTHTHTHSHYGSVVWHRQKYSICNHQCHQITRTDHTPPPTYRAVLALHAGAVEAEGRHAVADTLDVEDALVAPLARLRLGQVPGLQGDGLHLTCWDQNLLRAHQLGTVLEKNKDGGQGAHVSADRQESRKKMVLFFFRCCLDHWQDERREKKRCECKEERIILRIWKWLRWPWRAASVQQLIITGGIVKLLVW